LTFSTGIATTIPHIVSIHAPRAGVLGAIAQIKRKNTHGPKRPNAFSGCDGFSANHSHPESERIDPMRFAGPLIAANFSNSSIFVF